MEIFIFFSCICTECDLFNFTFIRYSLCRPTNHFSHTSLLRFGCKSLSSDPKASPPRLAFIFVRRGACVSIHPCAGECCSAVWRGRRLPCVHSPGSCLASAARIRLRAPYCPLLPRGQWGEPPLPFSSDSRASQIVD